MLRKRWRSKDEILYLFKYQLRDSVPWAVAGIWTSIIFVVGVYVKTTWEHDFPNWFATLLGFYGAVIVAMIVYFKAKKNQEIMESKIRKIEGIINSKFYYAPNNIQNLKFHILYALEGIIESYTDLRHEAKKWKRAKNKDEKNFHKDRFHYIWENSILEYGKILSNPEIVSDKIFRHNEVEELKNISEKCKIKPFLDENKNIVEYDKFHLTVVRCIVLLDKLKIDSKFRDILLKF